MNYSDLTAQQQEQLNGCTTAEELLALAKSEGVELTDDQLDAVSGGIEWDKPCDNLDRPGQ